MDRALAFIQVLETVVAEHTWRVVVDLYLTEFAIVLSVVDVVVCHELAFVCKDGPHRALVIKVVTETTVPNIFKPQAWQL